MSSPPRSPDELRLDEDARRLCLQLEREARDYCAPRSITWDTMSPLYGLAVSSERPAYVDALLIDHEDSEGRLPLEKEDHMEASMQTGTRDLVLAFVREHEAVKTSEVAEDLLIDQDEARSHLKALVDDKLIVMVGGGRGVRYLPAPTLLTVVPEPDPIAAAVHVLSDRRDRLYEQLTNIDSAIIALGLVA